MKTDEQNLSAVFRSHQTQACTLGTRDTDTSDADTYGNVVKQWEEETLCFNRVSETLQVQSALPVHSKIRIRPDFRPSLITKPTQTTSGGEY
jgi:hypothetical protein